MSWQLGAFAILAVGLAAGFAWYERTKPDARIVALVGTLAAFAALGRIAFAAIPNVKPTTDIVLVSGYALGGAPGFVTGATAALASNFFFGQGPWTPWQMAGWGATGLIGAALAPLTRNRIGRLPLAGVCFVVGFAFTVLQDVGDWVTYSDHSLGQLGVYVGKGVGFDLIHAVGCLVFALAFGPALIHSLSRFRLRLNITWLTPLIIATALTAAVPTPDTRAAATPVTYLLSAQNPDGGFGAAPSQSSSSLFSGWAALGLAAAGVHPHGLTAYIEAHPGRDPGSLERSILAIHAGGGPVGQLLIRLKRHVRRDGSVQNQTNLTAFLILAERAAGSRPQTKTIRWLVHQQDRDGGFNFATAPGQSDIDDTGAVLEALAGSGHPHATSRAIRFLRRHQNRNGGFPSQIGQTSNAQSTAFAVQGLIATGTPLGTLRHSPIAYLRSLIAPNGHVAYARGQNQTPVWVTAQAELALAEKALPLPAPRKPVVVPVSHKPPARKASRRVVHRTKRHVRRPRVHPHQAARTPPNMNGLSSDAGVLAALALAPLGV
jgi:energy-coupling factor transport system substrate-specific component